MSDLSVVIVSWNVKDYLRGCLDSVLRTCPEAEVLVVDNGSTDGSAAMVRSGYPGITLIANAKNRGFAAANNQAIGVSSGRYILLLNPDTVVPDGTIRRMRDFLEATPGAGAAGCRLTDPEKPGAAFRTHWLHFPGLAREVIADTVFENAAAFLHHASPGARPTGDDQARPVEIDWVSGACMMVRRKAVDQAGMMDEGLFLYMEDLEWCYRMQRHGWKVFLLPDAQVAHYGGKSTEQLGARRRVLHAHSKYLFFRKYRSGPALALVRLIKLPLLAFSIAVWAIGGTCGGKRRAETLARMKLAAAILGVVAGLG